MLYILHGPDTYRSREKLKEIIAEYRKKAGDQVEVHRFDADEDTIDEALGVLGSSSLFSTKRLVVLEYPFTGKGDAQKIEALAKRAKDSKDIFLIFWDREIPKVRSPALTSAKKYADKEQEFLSLGREQLAGWIQKESLRRGQSLTREEREGFLAFGNDLWRISNELEKLAASETLARAERKHSSTIFSLGDTFFTSRGRALSHLGNLSQDGEDGIALFSYLANHLRTLFVIRRFHDEKKAVPAAFGIHPYVQKKAGAIAQGIPMTRFKFLFRRFFEEDRKIKTGESTPEDSLVRIMNEN